MTTRGTKAMAQTPAKKTAWEAVAHYSIAVLCTAMLFPFLRGLQPEGSYGLGDVGILVIAGFFTGFAAGAGLPLTECTPRRRSDEKNENATTMAIFGFSAAFAFWGFSRVQTEFATIFLAACFGVTVVCVVSWFWGHDTLRDRAVNFAIGVILLTGAVALAIWPVWPILKWFGRTFLAGLTN